MIPRPAARTPTPMRRSARWSRGSSVGSDSRVRRRQRGRRDLVGDYFKSFCRHFAFTLPIGSRRGTAPRCQARCKHPRPARRRHPTSPGFPVLVNLPAFLIVVWITWLLLLGVRESAKTNNVLVVIKLLVLGCSSWRAVPHQRGELYALRPNGWRGFSSRRRDVFFAYIGSMRSRRRPKKRRTRSAIWPIGILAVGDLHPDLT